MVASLVIGILFLVLGLALRYWINRRKFYRRSPIGAESFSSYEKSVGIKFIERVGKWIAYALIIFGLLSLWVYSREKNEKEKDVFLNQISFGGGCINDTVMQISNPNLPFGGVGNSGRGNYHGKYGFLSFSHQKSVIDKPIWGEPNFRYPPYTSAKQKIVKKLQ